MKNISNGMTSPGGGENDDDGENALPENSDMKVISIPGMFNSVALRCVAHAPDDGNDLSSYIQRAPLISSTITNTKNSLLNPATNIFMAEKKAMCRLSGSSPHQRRCKLAKIKIRKR